MTATYKNILVAIDGSNQSEKAFKKALAICKSNDASLTIISIINAIEFDIAEYSLENVYTAEKKQIEKYIEKKIKQAKKKWNIKNHSPCGCGIPKKVYRTSYQRKSQY